MFWKGVKNVRKEENEQQIHKKDGDRKELTENIEVLERRKKHFEGLLNVKILFNGSMEFQESWSEDNKRWGRDIFEKADEVTESEKAGGNTCGVWLI